MNLAELTTAQVPAGTTLAVPVGATEQHGPHLPLDTDTVIATELCRRLATLVPGVLVAPPIPYGSSGEHAGFAGTLSIGQAAFELVVRELVRSADHFARAVIVNGHGGNLAPLRAAVAGLCAEGRTVYAWSPSAPADDTHAGHTETSVMLHLRPETVDLQHARPGVRTPLSQVIEQLRAGGVKAVSPNGVLGDPTHATATHGAAVLKRWTDDLVTDVRRWMSRAT